MAPIRSDKLGVFSNSGFSPFFSISSYEDLKALIAIKVSFQ